MNKIPRQYSLVKESDNFSLMQPKGTIFIFLGEIPNMLGHCIVITHYPKPGKIFSGCHTERFVELTEDEI